MNSVNRMATGMDSDAYHKHPAISRSAMMELERTPKHFWYKYMSGLYQDEESDALRIGSAFHTLVLEPALLEKSVYVWSGAPRNTKGGKEEYSQALENAAGRLLIKQSEFNGMKAMAKAILAEPASSKIIHAKGKIEASFFWHDENYRTEVKCRPDYYRDDGIVLDLKTCADASEETFQRSAVNYGYDLQAFMCMEGIERVTGKRPVDFVFMCVEKEPPHCVAFYSVTPEMLACGEARYHKLMSLYAACRQKDEWPGYGHFVRPIAPPEWYVKRLTAQGTTNV